MLNRHLVFPSLMIVISTCVLYIIQHFDQPHFQDASVNAQFFPTVIAIAQIAICIALIAQHKLKKTNTSLVTPLFTKMSLFGIAFLVVYAVAINIFGYLLASLVAFIAYLAIFKVKKPLYYVVACTFVVSVFYLFSEVFYIALPQGIFY
ncbi:tripartite tricarboxylate transporter TctB family protein [Vibrio panuliri]|uniref:Tripartite tricarboxylate transporter TctB family protein n=1 Tax=Vibrio panuliri TaxID=1381081 RepID=A0ABX3F5F3_9VIBR|nr:tripartite tricarboxylate transporter TctB family protein [Vibrio panuliri]KAB1457083.1 tripartite tricarboxylate transporter TctB family protein [Vibrio panuliri]OLQ85198.1 tripartite tricarboxylate transporter TctB family protein [Vibrio panuliri]